MWPFGNGTDYTQEAHDKGQADGSKNTYDNPGKSVGIFGHHNKDRAAAYDVNYQNGRDNPSSDEDDD